MRHARRTMTAVVTIGALLLLAACADPERDGGASPVVGDDPEATSPVGPQCLHAEGDVTGVAGDNEAIVPVTGLELAPGGESAIDEADAIAAAEDWWTDAGAPDTDVEPRAELHTVVSVDDPDLSLEAGDSVWVVRYEGIEAPDITEDVTGDLACAFVLVDAESGDALMTQYTRFQP